MKIWLDGAIVDPEDAKISVLDHGLLYGDGIFEGIRIYDRQVFRLDDHLARFAAGTRAIGLELPLDLDGVDRETRVVGYRRAHPLEAILGRRDAVLPADRLVGRIRARNEDHALQCERVDDLFGGAQVSRVDGIERPAEDTGPRAADHPRG